MSATTAELLASKMTDALCKIALNKPLPLVLSAAVQTMMALSAGCSETVTMEILNCELIAQSFLSRANELRRRGMN